MTLNQAIRKMKKDKKVRLPEWKYKLEGRIFEDFIYIEDNKIMDDGGNEFNILNLTDDQLKSKEWLSTKGW